MQWPEDFRRLIDSVNCVFGKSYTGTWPHEDNDNRCPKTGAHEYRRDRQLLPEEN